MGRSRTRRTVFGSRRGLTRSKELSNHRSGPQPTPDERTRRSGAAEANLRRHQRAFDPPRPAEADGAVEPAGHRKTRSFRSRPEGRKRANESPARALQRRPPHGRGGAAMPEANLQRPSVIPRSRVWDALMSFCSPSAHQAAESHLRRVCLTHLCCALRFSQPLDALLPPQPLGFVSPRSRSWGLDPSKGFPRR